MPCNCDGCNRFFNEKTAKGELKNYRKKGSRGSTNDLIKQLQGHQMEGLSLLDIGGGIGAISRELSESGVSRVTFAELSDAYFNNFSSSELGQRESTAVLKGDFIELKNQIPEHDIVTLDKMICCYPEMPDC